jgi:hypothetical protein
MLDQPTIDLLEDIRRRARAVVEDCRRAELEQERREAELTLVYERDPRPTLALVRGADDAR